MRAQSPTRSRHPAATAGLLALAALLILWSGGCGDDAGTGVGKVGHPTDDAGDLDAGGGNNGNNGADTALDTSDDTAPLDVLVDDDGGGTGDATEDDADADATADAADATDDADVDLDSGELTCTSCHGNDGNPAPPRDLLGATETTALGVGAHRNHLGDSDWHAPVQCEDCHTVPETVTAAGHIDPRPAELIWSDKAAPEGWPEPTWEAATCDGIYCHGATLPPSGTNTAPVWTDVGTGQAACGTCHGAPPMWPHPERSDCESCHSSMGPNLTFVDASLHINGTFEVKPLDCTSCHGSDGNAAPPADTRGAMDTAGLGVGAHRSHLGASAWHHEMDCTECHTVPSIIEAEGHRDSPLPAELAFGDLATHGGALAPVWDSVTCANIYCHGTTLAGADARRTPQWTRVGQGEANCGTCHGVPPVAPHPASNQCGNCHEDVYAEPDRHINGVLDLENVPCNTCHGNDLNAAPPRDTGGSTDTNDTGVGAHQSHLRAADWRAEIACQECHNVPSSVTSAGHIDSGLPAELMWGDRANHDGAMPAWDGANCADTYCHGGTLDGAGSNTAPAWTAVDQGEAACGTCHGAPPETAAHPSRTDCASCHPTMDAAGDFIAPERHIDGNLDLSDVGCSTCHGGDLNPAPPLDTTGGANTTLAGVGAHQSHLRDSDWRAVVVCEDCHVVPGTPSDPGHIDTALPAELTWGEKATLSDAMPTWDGTRCADTYCHGSTLNAAGTNTTPTWTNVLAGEADCGTCHGTPPQTTTHPNRTDCASCHPTMDAAGAFIAPDRHIDGVLDVIGLECNSCHGGVDNNAPPTDTHGNADTTLRGVGAHQSHLRDADWRAEIACTECHRVPNAYTDAGHIDTALPAELMFGTRATADGAAPNWTGTECAGVYCHGATLNANGTNTSPTWTSVQMGEADCGTCHGTPPQTATHPDRTDCASCHPTMNAAGDFIAPGRHIDGTLDVIGLACNTCHGSVTSNAPPVSTTGEGDTAVRGVGAHQSHLRTSSWHADVACQDCHTVPASVGAMGHMDTPLPAELTWGSKSRTGGATPTFNGTRCNGTYCHGATLDLTGTNTTPNWTNVLAGEADCGTCHGTPPQTASHPDRTDCATCHPTMNAAGDFNARDRHIDGILDLVPLNCTSCHGSGNDPAPPTDLAGNTATTNTGVGAHQSHLGSSPWRSTIACDDCHTVPQTVIATGHFDTALPAELTWGPRAELDGAAPDWDGDSCNGIYCHGATLNASGTHTTPTWTSVGTGEADCGTCHGAPPQTNNHPNRTDCATCHPTMDAAGGFLTPERHIDGILDVRPLSCNLCHGNDFNPAPPFDTAGGSDTALRGVGAHQNHLATSTWRASIACNDCHTVPVNIGDAGHLDSPLPAELTWGTRAGLDGAAPDWNGTNCADTYCHGATLNASGTHTIPTWTNVDAGEAACGTCHGAPPQTNGHPNRTDCATCHPTMNAAGNFTAPQRHIDGVLDVIALDCNSCHGGATNNAPPVDTTGGVATTLRGVGAHQSHLRTSDWHATVDCTECHTVPGVFTDAGHIDTALPAELTWGDTATAGGTNPSFNGTRCNGTYCHGSSLNAGGTNTSPQWTNVGTGQAACGSCHGAPPQTGTHPNRTDCATCHPTMNAAGDFTQPQRHIDGVLDVSVVTCTSCHGSGTDPAPPVSTSGGTATTLRGVGAHQSHLGASTWRSDIACTDCHTVPVVYTDPGHVDTALPAELTWGAKAGLDGANPAFNGTRCNGTYCHGATLNVSGTNTTPTWTSVGAGQAACGTCHGAPPSTNGHPNRTDCATCHPTMNAAGDFIDPQRHIDGILDVTALSCTSCHGSGTDPAPPVNTTGGSATSLRSVGAHQSHQGTSTWRAELLCTDCHLVPAAVGDAGHMDSALPAELTWGTRAGLDGANPAFTGTQCNNTYCHGATLNASGTNVAPTWTTVNGTQAACGTCHGTPPQTNGHPNRTDCATCHPTMNAAGNFIAPERHVDGILDVNPMTCTTCHGNVTNAAPPVSTTGGSATSLRGVGAHQSHLGTSSWHLEVLCTACHNVPNATTDAGHIDTALPAELTFTGVSRADGANPTWDGTRCTSAYCHGPTLGAGGTNVRPTWTTVNGSQAACGTCHATGSNSGSLSGEHQKHVSGERYPCSECHSSMSPTGGILFPNLHIDGIFEVNPTNGVAWNAGTSTCTGSCHGKTHRSERW